MTERPDVVLREVRDGDLDLLFAFRTDPEAIRMAADSHDPRNRAEFVPVWTRLRTEPWATARTIVSDEQVVRYIFSWEHFSQREVAFWIGREYWGRGIATAALGQFLELETERPLYAEAAGDLSVSSQSSASKRVQEGEAFENARDEPVGILLLATGLDD